MLTAQANIKKTWEDLLAEAQVQDRDAILEFDFMKGTGLCDPLHPVTTLCLYIYQIENFCFSELNRSSRFKDTTKVKTLGPWAAALYQIITFA